MLKTWAWAILTLALLLIVIPNNSQAATFKDVPANKYYYGAIEWGYKNGIISGDGTGYFHPEQYVTHGQFVKMFTEFYNIEMNYDKSLPAFEGYYKTLIDYGIEFNPPSKNELITRGEIAALIMVSQNDYYNELNNYHKAQLSYHTNEISAYMLDNKLSSGVTAANVSPEKKYGFYLNLKRGDAIQFLYNLSNKSFNKLKISSVVAQDFPKDATVVRSMRATNGVEYKVLKDDYVNYSGLFVYNGKIIGGYESSLGQTFEGIEMGKPLNADLTLARLNHRSKILIAYTDRIEKSIVRSVLWKSKQHNHEKLIDMALVNSRENQAFLNFLYTELINEFRAKNGESVVILSATLQKTALNHSMDMAQNDYFSHTNLQGRRSWERVLQVDSSFNLVGENISAGHVNLFGAQSSWINSPGHRLNMLESDMREVGFGSAISNTEFVYYYTVNIGARWR